MPRKSESARLGSGIRRRRTPSAQCWLGNRRPRMGRRLRICGNRRRQSQRSAGSIPSRSLCSRRCRHDVGRHRRGGAATAVAAVERSRTQHPPSMCTHSPVEMRGGWRGRGRERAENGVTGEGDRARDRAKACNPYADGHGPCMRRMRCMGCSRPSRPSRHSCMSPHHRPRKTLRWCTCRWRWSRPRPGNRSRSGTCRRRTPCQRTACGCAGGAYAVDAGGAYAGCAYAVDAGGAYAGCAYDSSSRLRRRRRTHP